MRDSDEEEIEQLQKQVISLKTSLQAEHDACSFRTSIFADEHKAAQEQVGALQSANDTLSAQNTSALHQNAAQKAHFDNIETQLGTRIQHLEQINRDFQQNSVLFKTELQSEVEASRMCAHREDSLRAELDDMRRTSSAGIGSAHERISTISAEYASAQDALRIYQAEGQAAQLEMSLSLIHI